VNPIFHWIVAHTTMKSLARECPSCKRTQIVAKGQAHEIVTCKHCGARIPPKVPSAPR
jgi:ribosomal protein S27E